LAGLILSAVFVLISILIIYNTIRLTIFARSEEIDIMKLVGASDWYIRGPFIIEGLGYGIIGALISSTLFYFSYRIFVPVAERYLDLPNLNSNYLGMNILIIIAAQVFIGLLLGAFCSTWAIRKHLK
jgi:cell division transport system permease protein